MVPTQRDVPFKWHRPFRERRAENVSTRYSKDACRRTGRADEMTEEQASRLVLMLCANWPNTRPEAESLRLFERIIRPLNAEDAEAVVMELIATSEDAFLPKPATILRMAAMRRMALDGRAPLSGEEAWAKVQQCIEQRGFYRGPGNLDTQIQRAVAAVGWDKLCHDENVAASRAHFIKIYNAIQEREEKDEVAALVAAEHGWALPSPEPRRALAYDGDDPEDADGPDDDENAA
jgi:hypothetical protein